MTQETAAEMCELPLRTYQAVLYGQHFPREKVLTKICTGYGVDTDYFLSTGGGVVTVQLTPLAALDLAREKLQLAERLSPEFWAAIERSDQAQVKLAEKTALAVLPKSAALAGSK